MPSVAVHGGRALRRALLAAAGMLCVASAAAQSQATKLPLRNLLVELRQGDAASLDVSAAGVQQGAVVVGSDGRASGRAGVGAEARSRSASGQSVQQVTVLNGGRAALRMGTSQPVHWVQIGWTPQGPAVVGIGSVWVDTGRGVVVQPRWPGGDAPVTVEVEADSSTPTAAGGTAGSRTLTTLALPLGDWVTVAETSDAGMRSERGTLSTRELAASRRLLVQMRVSAP